jgi:hypothetical protein
MFGKRRDDGPANGEPQNAQVGDPRLRTIAVEWLHELLREEFTGDASIAPGAAGAAGSVPSFAEMSDEEMLRVSRREWLSRWRRLQLPEQLAAYRDELDAAPTREAIHATFSRHATAIVGAYVCLVFLPTDDEMLAPVEVVPGPFPLPALRLPGSAVLGSAVVHRPDLTPGSPLEGVAPLFERERAAALLVTPYTGGCAVLVERREARVFGELDLQLLDLVSAEAGTALRRLAVAGSVAPAGTARGAGGREETVLRHARAGAALGFPMTTARVRLHEPVPAAGDLEGLMRHCAATIRRESRGAGPALRTGEREFLLVLNGGVEAVRELLDRIRPAFGEGARLETSIEAAPGPSTPSD